MVKQGSCLKKKKNMVKQGSCLKKNSLIIKDQSINHSISQSIKQWIFLCVCLSLSFSPPPPPLSQPPFRSSPPALSSPKYSRCIKRVSTGMDSALIVVAISTYSSPFVHNPLQTYTDLLSRRVKGTCTSS